MSKVTVSEGEDPPDEDELRIMKELEEDSRRIFDLDNKIFDYSKQKSTDTNFSRRLYLPKQKYPKLEALECLRATSIARESKDWMDSHCDSKGNQLINNNSAAMRAAIKKLKSRIDSGNMIVVPTDKSGKFAAMSLQTYIDMGEVHTRADKTITESELAELQKNLMITVK